MAKHDSRESGSLLPPIAEAGLDDRTEQTPPDASQLDGTDRTVAVSAPLERPSSVPADPTEPTPAPPEASEAVPDSTERMDGGALAEAAARLAPGQAAPSRADSGLATAVVDEREVEAELAKARAAAKARESAPVLPLLVPNAVTEPTSEMAAVKPPAAAQGQESTLLGDLVAGEILAPAPARAGAVEAYRRDGRASAPSPAPQEETVGLVDDGSAQAMREAARALFDGHAPAPPPPNKVRPAVTATMEMEAPEPPVTRTAEEDASNLDNDRVRHLALKRRKRARALRLAAMVLALLGLAVVIGALLYKRSKG